MLNKTDPQIKWFEEARLGLFIHWGLYTATEGYYKGKETQGISEWIQSREQIPMEEYEKFTDNLSADSFDAEKIAEMASYAGMKYMVFTSKHHDGFAMFDSKYDDYTINARCGVECDLVKELTDAMRKKGIVPCLYYSQALDFHEENATGNIWDFDVPEDERDFLSYINGKSKFQIKELLTNYGDIGMLWFDVPRGITPEIATDLRNYVKSIQPNCLINGRLGGDGKDWDFLCMGDNETPSGKVPCCAETCATMNDSWGYKRNDKTHKSPKTIIELLCSLVSKGVNLLLNIGPKPDGSVPEACIHILKVLGDWMQINSEAVHGTKASPFMTDYSFGWTAQKGHNLYLYLKRPVDEITLYGLENEVLSAETMSGQKITACKNEKGVSVNIKNVNFDDTVTVLKLVLDSEPRVVEKLYQQEKDYIMLPGACSNVVLKEANDAVKQDFKYAMNRKVGEYKEVNPVMNVNINGIVELWTSTENYIYWETEVKEPGEYDAVLYTVTLKYQPWTGGHKVRLECGEQQIQSMLSEDLIPDGVNRKYFAETGSILGKIVFDKPGKYTIRLFAEDINEEDPLGLSVTRMILKNSSVLEQGF